MLDSVFNEFAKKPDLTFFPPSLKDAITENNDMIYNTVNNGVYRCGFATTQEAYNKAEGELFGMLDKLEGILATQRYMNGDVVTDTDIRLFMTLIRFDPVYVCHFKCARRAIREYPNLSAYTRDLYQTQAGLRDSVKFDHIKNHYYGSHAINKYGIVPRTDESWLEVPHGRDALSTGAGAGAGSK